jgi:amidase
MKRRKFIQNSAFSGLAIGSLSATTACASDAAKSPAGTQAEQAIDYNQFELLETTVAALQEDYRSGAVSIQQVTQLYLDRITRIDQEGPKLNSVIEVNPEAIAIAKMLDEELKSGKDRGPMHGIPILIKDNINTGDQMMTTAGSLALEGNKASTDAFIITQLRAAGAVLLGKTNLSEWANFRSTRSSSGWSSRGKQTRNPYILDRNPCGSSSGSGAAVSANLCAIAIGTETNGSIVCPSSTNGVVGIKPTVGLWSRTGIIPISFSQDTAGPMARTVADAAALLGALTGVDANDSKTEVSIPAGSKDYTEFLDVNGLAGKRIGIWRSPFGFHEKVDEVLEESIEAMKSAGAEIVDLDEVIEDIRELYGPSRIILEYEFKDGLNSYLANAQASSGVKSLADVISYMEANPETTMPYFQKEILDSSEARGDLNDQDYIDAVNLVQTRSRKGIDNTIDNNKLDAIMGPTGGPAWMIDVVNGDNYGGGSSSPAAWSGYPNISVPAGFVHGLPVGISFFGKAWQEGPLISIAYAFEQARKARKAPTFQPNLAFND